MGLVTLTDVRAHLNLDPSDTTHDVELQGFIDAMTPVLTYMTGPILPTPVVGEVHDGGSPVIMLRNPPVMVVTSLVEYIGSTSYALTQQQPGATVNAYGFSVDSADGGKITRRSGAGLPQPFYGGPGSVVVSYTAGLPTVPPDVRLAALEDLRGLYQQTQQGGRPQFGSGAEDDGYGAGPLALFPRLEMLLEGRFRTVAIA